MFSECWAIMPSKLAEIHELAERWAAGADIQPFAAKERPAPQVQASNIAVIPIFGTITRRGNIMSDFSGGTSVEKLRNQFRSAVQDPSISAIVFNVDSPGGGVFGIDELAREIYQARGKKRIAAIADPIAGSAAIWLATAASELVVTPSGEAGSIGVYSMHQDVSAANEKLGVKPTFISAGKYKVEGNPYEPLTDEARAHIQQDVDRYYAMFTSAVARHRGVKRAEVVNGMGEGRMLGAKDAVAAGLADWVGTLDELLADIKSDKTRVSPRAAIDHNADGSIYWRRQQYS